MERLLATCWTSAGNVRPGITADESPEPIEKRIRAVAAAGYSGIGFEFADLVVARDRLGLGRLRALIAESGLTTTELEFIDDWYTTGDRREISDRRRTDLIRMASILGAAHIKVGGGRSGDVVEPEVLRAEFAQLAADAGAHGTRVALEPAAFSMLNDLDDAISLVTDVNDPNGGLLLDVWHLSRSGYEYGRLPETLPPWALLAVELDDGLAQHGEDLLGDTFDHRKLAGSGDFRTGEFVSAIRRIGFCGPWGVENMSIEHRSLPIDTALVRAKEAALTVLEGSTCGGR